MSCAQNDALFQGCPASGRLQGGSCRSEGDEAAEAGGCVLVGVARGAFPGLFHVVLLGVMWACVHTHSNTHSLHTHSTPTLLPPGSKMVSWSSRSWDHWVNMLSFRSLDSKKGPWLGGFPTFCRPRSKCAVVSKYCPRGYADEIRLCTAQRAGTGPKLRACGARCRLARAQARSPRAREGGPALRLHRKPGVVS